MAQLYAPVLVPFLLSVSDDRPSTPFAWEAVCFLVSLGSASSRVVITRLKAARGTHSPAADSLSTWGLLDRPPSSLSREHARRAGCSLLSAAGISSHRHPPGFIYHGDCGARRSSCEHLRGRFHAWAREVPAIPAPASAVRRASFSEEGAHPGVARALRHRHGISGADTTRFRPASHAFRRSTLAGGVHRHPRPVSFRRARQDCRTGEGEI